jgi:hypothetical protein
LPIPDASTQSSVAKGDDRNLAQSTNMLLLDQGRSRIICVTIASDGVVVAVFLEGYAASSRLNSV